MSLKNEINTLLLHLGNWLLIKLKICFEILFTNEKIIVIYNINNILKSFIF